MNKQDTPKTLPKFRRKPLITALESRILLDGAAVATAVEMTTDVAFQQDAVHQPAPDQAVHFSDGSLALAPTQIKAGDPSQNNGRKEVAFVDSSVEDYQTLVDGIGAGIEVQLIDGSQDGLAQLAVWAQQNSGYDAIHILSHGEQGQISLGTLILNTAVVDARSAELANLGAALTADGDLLLYGCEVTSEGSQTFVTALATATGADVAASEDLTGTQARGGDWQLEYHQGEIDTEGLNVESYDGVLAEPVQVSVFSYPGLNGSGTQPGDENANLTSIIQAQIDGGANYSLDTSITSFTDPDLAEKLAASGFFFMTDMENQNPTDIGFFPESARTIFRDWVNDGGVIMMTGTGGSNDVNFLNLIFGWDLSNATHSDNSPRVDSNAAGTPFENVTADYLPPMNASETINKGTVENFKTIYGSDTNAAVATIEYGSGHVIYMGFDFYGAGTEGDQYSSSWVQEIIPAAMEYSAALAGSGDVDEDQTYTFSADAFKSGSTVLSQVKITSLPTHGSLSLSGTAVSADQIITSEQYDLLTYTPNENFNGEDGFNWQGYDGEEYGADTSYDLTVSPVNDAPIFGAANTSTQVSVFSSPNLNGNDASPGTSNENANLSSIVQSVINEGGEYSLDTSITGFTDAGFSDKLNASGFFFMTDMEKGDPRDTEFLPESAKTTMKDWVGAGGVMMMTGTYGSNDTDFLNTIFGWDLTTQSGSSWNLNTSNAAGTPFAGGPSSLDNPSATDSIGKGTVEGFSAIYGTDDNATVAVINYGSGTVIFLGFDFYDTGISGTGFTDTAPQYGGDVSDGGQRTNAWVTEIIPRAMEYSANLSASVILSQSDSGLSATDSLTVTDVDLTDKVNVSISSVTAAQRDANGDLISSSATEPDSATLLAMLSLPSQPVVDAESTEGTLNWTFDSGDETFGYLGVDEQLVLTYTLTADDGNGGTAIQNIEIIITGNNDAPVAENDAVIAIEAGGVANGSTGTDATGNVLSNDSDVDDGDTKTVTGVVFGDTSGTVGNTLNGQYGSLTLNEDGSYSYVIDENNAAVQALRLSGQTLTESFSYSVTDAAGATDTATLTITIEGSNDAPVALTTNIDEQWSFGKDYERDISVLFTDIDSAANGEDLDFVIKGLPKGLSYNPETGMITGKPTESGKFAVTLTAVDQAGAEVSRVYQLEVLAPPQDTPVVKSVTNNDVPPFQSNNTSVTNDLSSLPQGLVNKDGGADSTSGVGFVTPRAPVETVLLSESGALVVQTTGTDGKITVRAAVDVNVSDSGEVVFTEVQQQALDTVALRVSSIVYGADNDISISIADSNAEQGQRYSGALADGTALPDWISIDPKTGDVSLRSPGDVKELTLRIQAVGSDGQTRILEIKLNIEELQRNKAAGNADQPVADVAATGFVPLAEQLAAEVDTVEGYGHRLLTMLTAV